MFYIDHINYLYFKKATNQTLQKICQLTCCQGWERCQNLSLKKVRRNKVKRRKKRMYSGPPNITTYLKINNKVFRRLRHCLTVIEFFHDKPMKYKNQERVDFNTLIRHLIQFSISDSWKNWSLQPTWKSIEMD